MKRNRKPLSKSCAMAFVGIAIAFSGLSCGGVHNRRAATEASKSESRAMSTADLDGAGEGYLPAKPEFQSKARFANYFQTPPEEMARRPGASTHEFSRENYARD